MYETAVRVYNNKNQKRNILVHALTTPKMTFFLSLYVLYNIMANKQESILGKKAMEYTHHPILCIYIYVYIYIHVATGALMPVGLSHLSDQCFDH